MAAVQAEPGEPLGRLVGAAARAGAWLVALPAVAADERAAVRLAAELGLYLAFPTPAPADPSVPRAGRLVGPDGRVALEQPQTHRSPAERAAGRACGATLAVGETPFGRIGYLVGEDARYPEVAAVLVRLGATVLVHDCALPAPYRPAEQLRRLWREVQAHQVFGLEACLVGTGWAGRAAVLAPCELTEGSTGRLAAARSTDRTEVVVAELDFERLEAIRRSYPIARFANVGLYRRWFPALYGEPAAPLS